MFETKIPERSTRFLELLGVKKPGIVPDGIPPDLDGISTGVGEEHKARAAYEAESRGAYSP